MSTARSSKHDPYGPHQEGPREKPYHHGRLREVVLEAALREIEAVGTGRMSMREIARRAGVSHAAPAHHFGDKAGIFTAIATQGYNLLRNETERVTRGSDALLRCGLAYVSFALTHPAHFEVMFRPEIYRSDDAELAQARDSSFQVLYSAVEKGLGPGRADEVLPTSIAAWSSVHGFATLWLNGNLQPKLGEERDAIDAFGPEIAQGFIAMAEIVRRQVSPG